MLYCHLYCNSKCHFSSSVAYWQKQPPDVFYKKGVLTNFSKFTGKHLCQGLFFKRFYYRFFPMNFPKFAGPLFFQNTFGRLLLYLEPCWISMIDFFVEIIRRYITVSFSCIVNKITWRYSSSRAQMFLKVARCS